MYLNIINAPVEVLRDELFLQKKVFLSVLRLDKIHPVVSGNKLFKLHYFLQDAAAAVHKTILTFGGAWSNHLVATAYACHASGLKSIGIVRGEKPSVLSSALEQCISYGMQLKFITREKYTAKEGKYFLAQINNDFGECIIIPEGGYHPLGAKGAALIYDSIKQNNYTHICTGTGTGTTLAGLLIGSKGNKIISVPALKGMADIESRVDFLCSNTIEKDNLQIFNDYHFGGYAKKTPELISFMNYLWQQHQLATDFVYTAKLFFAIYDKIKNNYFDEGSNIVCLHTGGLQGNNSLSKGTLLF
jgi:1-aminocyclopropane-1-carboxylate deaminase